MQTIVFQSTTNMHVCFDKNQKIYALKTTKYSLKIFSCKAATFPLCLIKTVDGFLPESSQAFPASIARPVTTK